MEKIWLANYPAGVPAEISVDQYKSLSDFMDERFKQFAKKRAFISAHVGMTYRQLEEYSLQMAGWLQSLGLEKGSRVALMLPNCFQYTVMVPAIFKAGLVVVNVNPLYTARELEHQLKDSGADVIVLFENFAHTFESIKDNVPIKHVVVTSLGELLGFPKGLIINFLLRHVKKMVPDWNIPNAISFKQALAIGKSVTLKPVPLEQSDIAFLQYTGGTTGVSKGAALSHGNLLANIAQASAWFAPGKEKLQKEGKFNPNDEHITVVALPLYHIFALNICYFLSISEGGTGLLIANPRDIKTFVGVLKKYKVAIFPAVNTLFNSLLDDAEFRELDFSGLQITMGGGTAVQRAVSNRWKEITGQHIIEGYGLSETSPVACACPVTSEEFSGTIGMPVPSTEISIRDDNGNPVELGQPGEICIKGPQVMVGYWQRPDETAKVMTHDGFFKSGDIGYMDQRGYVKIVDRKKDMILVSGFNVYPNEVEEVVAMHPKVHESAAVGVPDEHSGEAVKLFVVKRDPSLTKEELIEYCKENLTGYKRPKYIEFRDDLPKTNVGKILRRELRNQ